MFSRRVGLLGSLQLTVAYFLTDSVLNVLVLTLMVTVPSPPGRTSRVNSPREQPQPGLTFVILRMLVPVLRNL